MPAGLEWGVTPEDPLLVWGGGAIGGTLAATWAQAGIPVHLVDVQAEHVQATRTTGLHIHGPVTEFSQVIPAFTPQEVRGSYSTIVLAVKAQATEDAVRMLAPHLRPDGHVLSAQNGLNEITLSRLLGAERTMGCFVNFGADWHGPGSILFGNRAVVVVGEIDGTVRERTRRMHALLQVFEPQAVLTDNIWGYLWGKLAYGAMLFATALTADSMSANFADPERFAAFNTVAREVMAVARARGVEPIGFNGFDPANFFPGASEAGARASIAALAEFNAKTAKTHSGIYRDLAVRKRRTEVDPQVGMVGQLGREAGIPTPAIDRLLELIHDIEEGRRTLSRDTLQELIKVCG